MMPKIILPLILVGAPVLNGQDVSERVLFSFQDGQPATSWRTVNDGVMGGRSDGRVRINAAKKMEFFGTLSLANNGGFASVRSRRMPLGLSYGDLIVILARGDGRVYSLNLYTPNRQTAFSYRASFRTVANQWIEAAIPVDQFVATSFGRIVPNRPLDPRQVDGIGILLGDKRPGPFKLEVESIRVRCSSAPPVISNSN